MSRGDRGRGVLKVNLTREMTSLGKGLTGGLGEINAYLSIAILIPILGHVRKF